MTDLSRYLCPQPRSSRWIWVLISALVLGAAWLGAQAYQLHTQAVATQARVDKLRERQAAQAKIKPSVKELEEQKKWAALKQEQDFPWQKVFKAVERASSKEIELLEFQPDKRNRIIVLRGEARDEAALVAYLDRLAMQTGLRDVHLLHQQNVTRDRLETVSFEMKARLTE
jgi:hypothetical protein